MSIVNKKYDLVLVVTSFRRCNVYPVLIKQLQSKYKIGVYLVNLTSQDNFKTNKTNTLFLELLSSFDVEIIDSKVECNIIIVPQWHYTKQQITSITTHVKYNYAYWMLGLANGNYSYNNLFNIEIDKVLVIDRSFYDFRLENRPEEKKINIANCKYIETGLPYDKYPLFPGVEIDFLIAGPTPFSLPTPLDRYKYLDNVNRVLKKIQKDNIVVYKPHNASEAVDVILNKKIYILMSSVNISFIRRFVYFTSRFLYKKTSTLFINEILLELLIVEKYEQMVKHTISLELITKYYNFNLEVFLPGVKKGVITGRSNTIWHCLFQKIPVYNCTPSSTEEINPDKMHAKNMQYFGIGSCEGEMRFQDEQYNIISDTTRKADFVKFLDFELQRNSVL